MPVVVFLTTGTSFTVPYNWNSNNNTVEVIGGGAGGDALGGGGGGGAYSKILNLALTPGASVTYQVGAGGSSGNLGTDSWFNGASLAASSVGAKGGSAPIVASGGVGGLASAGLGSTKFNGGTGGSLTGGNAGGGGGGAAGLNGAGVNGVNGTVGLGGNGGAGDNSSGGSGGNGVASGTPNPGNPGAEYTSYQRVTGGSGGGGGGNAVGVGGAGGSYGAGGGAGTTTGGAGANGLIVLTYESTALSRPPIITRITQVPRSTTLLTHTYVALALFFAAPQGHNQYDWPVPKAAQPSVSLKTHINCTQLQLGLPRGPCNYDQPNPVRLLPRSIELITWIQTGYVEEFAAAPFRQASDWPNPRGPSRAIDLLTHVQDGHSNLLLRGQDTFTAAGNNWDWPNPTRVLPRSVELLTWLQSGYVEEFAAAPFVQSDWPYPRGYARSLDLLTHTQDGHSNLVLLGQDTFFGDPGMGPTYDWPNPTRLLPKSVDLLTWAQSGYLEEVGEPFSQIDWPNPRGPSRCIDLLSWSQSTFAATYTIKPTSQTDWPNPRGYARANELLTWLQTGYQEEAPRPFTQTSWPVPPGYVPANALKTHLDSYKLTLIGKDRFTAGGNCFDWPNPRGYRRSTDLLTWLQTGYTGAFSASPFIQTEWPYPRGYSRSVDLITHTQDGHSVLLLPGQDRFTAGGNNPNLPVPQGYRRSVELLTWLQTGYVEEFAAQPFIQTEWPVPSGYRRSVELLSWRQSGFLEEAGEPFAQTNWPVPKGYIPGVSLKTHIDQTKFLLIGKDVLPIRQREWPVPPGYRRSVDLVTWLQIGWVQEFSAPPFHQTEWPYPRGYVPSVTLKTWTDPTKIKLIGKDFLPFRQSDWPLAVTFTPRVIDLRTWRQTFLYGQGVTPPPPPPPPPVPTGKPKKMLSLTSGGKGMTQVSGKRGRTQTTGKKGRTDASDP